MAGRAICWSHASCARMVTAALGRLPRLLDKPRDGRDELLLAGQLLQPPHHRVIQKLALHAARCAVPCARKLANKPHYTFNRSGRRAVSRLSRMQMTLGARTRNGKPLHWHKAHQLIRKMYVVS